MVQTLNHTQKSRSIDQTSKNQTSKNQTSMNQTRIAKTHPLAWAVTAWLLCLAAFCSTASASDVYLLKMEHPFPPLPTVDVLLDTQHGGPVNGWIITICHEETEVEWNDLYYGSAVTNLPAPPEFEAITPFSNGFTVETILDSTLALTLPADEDLHLYSVDYVWVPTGSYWTDLTFCDPGGSTYSNMILRESVATLPYTFDTFMFNGVVDPMAIYRMPFSAGTYDGGSGIGSISIEPVVLAGLVPSFELDGLSMAVSHDGDLFQVDSVIPSGQFAESNGGAGPDLVLVEILDNGWTIDMTVDTAGIEVVPFNGGLIAVEATYSTIPSAASSSACVSSWLRFDNTLGINNEIDFTGFGTGGVCREDSVLMMSPVVKNFIRGDVNLDSSIDLSDGISQLESLFSGSWPLDCEDAADTNDDGAFNIADTIFLLSYLFSGGSAPADPFGSCGPDPTFDSLGCDSPPCP